MLSCSIWFSAPSFWKGGGLESRCVGRVCGAGVAVHGTATYRCDDTRGCIVQFWPPDDEHVCSKHVEA